MSEQFIRYALVAVYVSVLCVVALYGFHRYILLYLYLKHKKDHYEPLGTWDQLPKVTVQLPMYNEDTVAERIIRATCHIDYPLDRLEIQVLDDSTDHSADIARLECEAWAAKGYPIKYIHRDNREGYKAGALAEGLLIATGKFVAIFDADFIPPRDIIRNTIQYFTDKQVGCVQVRWDHLNRDASLLTKSQAIFLDGHFVIEHTARNRSGRFMHFNGTAGVWRRSCIEDGGGWQHDTLTEDLDLSYRCQLKGWQFVYLPQFSAPAELPPEMIAFKQQAHRWTKGSMQTCIKLLPRIMKSKHLPWSIKTEAFFHLTNTLVYPMMVLVTLLMWPTFFKMETPLKDHQHFYLSRYAFSGTLFILATCSASFFFCFGQKELFGKNAGWKTLLHLPFLMGLGVGICINNTKAVIEAIVSSFNGKKQSGEFVRTPKYGATSSHRGSSVRKRRIFTFDRLMSPILEIAFGLYMASCALISLQYHFARVSIPFSLIFASGYLYVGFSSLLTMYQMSRDTSPAPTLLPQLPTPPEAPTA
jgi:cellulose synthase/poly-beta-1,6-N-acetylglucosamine synthase-like glycosyltransferase